MLRDQEDVFDSVERLSLDAFMCCRESALSFPVMPAWLGIHQNLVLVPEFFKLYAARIIS